MLVSLHALIDIMSYHASSVHSNSYNISKLLIVRCLAPVHLSLASCQNISVEFSTELVQCVDLHSVCKNTQTVKIFHYDSYAIIRFGAWGLPKRCRTPKIADLPRNLITCFGLMLGYLESCMDKMRLIISQ